MLRPGSCGLRVWPPTALQPLVEAVERKLAHSDRFVAPSTTMPAARSCATSGASATGGDDSSAREPAVPGSPTASMLSLISTGTPSSGPSRSPLRRRWSLAAAAASASGAVAITACRVGFSRSIRAR